MGITITQYRAQIFRNHKTLLGMVGRAKAVAPQRYRGYTVAQLEARAQRFYDLLNLSDVELSAHLLPLRRAIARDE